MAPIGVLVDLGVLGELGDEALPEEHRRGRADRAHEIDRHRQRRVDGLDQEVRQPVALIVDAVDHALVPVAFGRMVEPALARRAEQRLAGDAGVDRQRIAGLVEHRAQAAAGVRTIDVVLHVFFARADELDRAPDRLRGVHGLHHEVGNDLAAEAAAQERDVDRHVVGRAPDAASATASWQAVTDWIGPQTSTLPSR